MILSTGCSWTYGTGVKPSETYSAHLQNKLGTQVINAGAAGTDIEYSVWTTYRLVKEYDVKLVLFQLTTLDRMTFATNGKTNFINNVYHNGATQDLFVEDNTNIRFYGIGDNKIDYITVASYLDAVKGRDEKSNAIKYFNENVVFSNLKQEKISMQLQMLKEYLKTKDINIVFFPWLPWHAEFSNTLDPVDIRTDCVTEFLGNGYYIDNGFHVSNEGHKIVAEDYIMPMIKDYV